MYDIIFSAAERKYTRGQREGKKEGEEEEEKGGWRVGEEYMIGTAENDVQAKGENISGFRQNM